LAPARSENLLLGAAGDSGEEVEIRARAGRALGRKHSQAAEPILLRWLGDPNPRLRAAAAEALGELCAPRSRVACAPRAAPALGRPLADTESAVRSAAIASLARLGARVAVPAVAGRLEDENVGVRRSAALALGELGDRRAVLPLIARLADASREVRAAS